MEEELQNMERQFSQFQGQQHNSVLEAKESLCEAMGRQVGG